MRVVKRPLKLKQSIEETLSHNQIIIEYPFKSSTTFFPECRKTTRRQKDEKLQKIYNQFVKNQQQYQNEEKSQELLLQELEREDEDDDQQIPNNSFVKIESKDKILSHLLKHTNNQKQKIAQLSLEVEQQIKKHSFEVQYRQKFPQVKKIQINEIIKPKRVMSFKQIRKKELQRDLPLKLQEIDENSEQINLTNKKLSHVQYLTIRPRISQCLNLKKLILSYNCLTNKSMPSIIDILSNKMLQQLSLKWNLFNYQAIKNLFANLSMNSTLLSLDISYNSLTNTSQEFIDRIKELFVSNKCLLHLNMEMCHLSEGQCQIIADCFNLKNQTIVGMHFKGNSNYFVNRLGFITENNQEVSLLNDKHVGKTNTKDKNTPFSIKLIKSQTKNINSGPIPSSNKINGLSQKLHKYLKGQDCCWHCQKWICEQFKFYHELQPEYIRKDHTSVYFIHLSCFDYQPIRLFNTSNLNNHRKKSGLLLKKLEWHDFQIFSVVLAVPSNCQLYYFFTCNGNVFLNSNEKTMPFVGNIRFKIYDVFGKHCRKVMKVSRQQNEEFHVFLNDINVKKPEQLYINKVEKQKKIAQADTIKETQKNMNVSIIKRIINRNNTRKNIISRSNNSQTKPKNTNSKKCIQNNIKTMKQAQIQKARLVPQFNNKMLSFNYNKLDIMINTRKLYQKHQQIEPKLVNRLTHFCIVPRSKSLFYDDKLIKHFQDQIINRLKLPAMTQIQKTYHQITEYIDLNFKFISKRSLFNKLTIQRMALQTILKHSDFTDKYFIITRNLSNNKQQAIISEVAGFFIQQFVGNHQNHFYPMAKKDNILKKIKLEAKPKKVAAIKDPTAKTMNKSVKFCDASLSNQSDEVSIAQIQQQKSIKSIKFMASSADLRTQKFITRSALSMNCLRDRYRLAIAKNLPFASLGTFNNTTYHNLTQKSIKSMRNIAIKQQQTPLLGLTFHQIAKSKTDLKDEVANKYTHIVAQYIREKIMINDLMNEDYFQKEKMKEINQIIVTHNYFKICHFYQHFVHTKIVQSLSKVTTLKQLIFFNQPESTNQKQNKCTVKSKTSTKTIISKQKQFTNKVKSTKTNQYRSNQLGPPAFKKMDSASVDENNNDQTMDNLQYQFQGNDQPYDAFQSLMSFLTSDHHPLKHLVNKSYEPAGKSLKKRNGKYGRSLKNIKQQLLGDHKLILPADNAEIIQIIQKQKEIISYNNMIRQLNLLSDIFIAIIDQIVQAFHCGNLQESSEDDDIFQWIKEQIKSRVSNFLTALFRKYKIGRVSSQAIKMKNNIFQQYFMNTFVELIKMEILFDYGLGRERSQSKQSRLVNCLFNYQYIINEQIHKLVKRYHIMNEESNFVADRIQKILDILLQHWQSYQLKYLLQRDSLHLNKNLPTTSRKKTVFFNKQVDEMQNEPTQIQI